MTQKNQEISQLHRIAGQIGGIEKLINNQAKSSEVIQQIEAARANLKSLEKTILKQKIKVKSPSEEENLLNYLLKIS